ncbi:MAG TPA: hypothetical protein VG712_07200 [Gemmatimonadales bacterium]|nr:hypothetical protein [Gemmatimonadales bacterium]
MARYKILGSVAHNFAHSFVSVMNYHGRDYTMCHLVRRSKVKAKRRLSIDVLARSAAPVDLLTKDIASAIESYCDGFGRFVTSGGAALDMVAEARIELTIRHGRVVGATDKHLHAFIDAEMTIVDDRGRKYLGTHSEKYVCDPLR